MFSLHHFPLFSIGFEVYLVREGVMYGAGVELRIMFLLAIFYFMVFFTVTAYSR
jgi:hypothetical protein